MPQTTAAGPNARSWTLWRGNERYSDITPTDLMRYYGCVVRNRGSTLSMRISVRFAISTFLTCSCLLFARIQAQSPQEQNQQETPPELTKVCSAKNPPPCATPPRVISAPSAQFSEPARGKEFNAVCTLNANVEPDGSTSHIRVLTSVPWKYRSISTEQARAVAAVEGICNVETKPLHSELHSMSPMAIKDTHKPSHRRLSPALSDSRSTLLCSDPPKKRFARDSVLTSSRSRSDKVGPRH
jgi:hypothetical protein